MGHTYNGAHTSQLSARGLQSYILLNWVQLNTGGICQKTGQLFRQIYKVTQTALNCVLNRSGHATSLWRLLIAESITYTKLDQDILLIRLKSYRGNGVGHLNYKWQVSSFHCSTITSNHATITNLHTFLTLTQWAPRRLVRWGQVTSSCPRLSRHSLVSHQWASALHHCSNTPSTLYWLVKNTVLFIAS